MRGERWLREGPEQRHSNEQALASPAVAEALGDDLGVDDGEHEALPKGNHHVGELVSHDLVGQALSRKKARMLGQSARGFRQQRRRRGEASSSKGLSRCFITLDAEAAHEPVPKEQDDLGVVLDFFDFDGLRPKHLRSHSPCCRGGILEVLEHVAIGGGLGGLGGGNIHGVEVQVVGVDIRVDDAHRTRVDGANEDGLAVDRLCAHQADGELRRARVASRQLGLLRNWDVEGRQPRARVECQVRDALFGVALTLAVVEELFVIRAELAADAVEELDRRFDAHRGVAHAREGHVHVF